MENKNSPQFPIYLPSKGRYEVRLTSDYLTYIKVNHILVVEEQEYELYKKYTKDNPFIRLIVLDKKYQEEYDTFDKLGDTKSKGPGAARNFIWDHSIKEGHKWHWVIDDNIKSFYRFNRNRQIKVKTGAIFRAMEDFCLRYENVYMAGPNYFMFVARKEKNPPIIMNTRIYSCNLIRNDIPFRWRGRYNEDTDLSLRILKAGFCTIQFNAFLQEKARTQTVRGGNTGEFYTKDGTYPKSKMQVDMHPDISRIVHKFGRVHHYVDYSSFKKNKLVLKKNIKIDTKQNEYGMDVGIFKKK